MVANQTISFNGSTDTNEAISGDGTNLILTSGGTSYKIPTTGQSNGNALITNGSGDLSWATPAASGGSVDTATNIAGGLANEIPFQTAANDTSFNSDLTYNSTNNTLSATNFSGTNLKLTNSNTITLTAANQSGDATLSIPGLGGTGGNIVVDNISQTFSDVITYSSTPIFNSNISVKNGASAAAVEIYEASGNGTNKVSLTSPASLTSDATVTLPNATGTLALTSELHSAVTLATVANNYLGLSGQVITAGTVPVSLGGTGATGAAAARSNLDVDQAGTDNSTPVTLATVTNNYLGLSGQVITAGTVPVSLGGTGATGAANAATALGLGTGNDPQFNSINLGHASDTTIARDSAGVVSIEGAVVRTGTVAVANGGTGATSAPMIGVITAANAADAATALGLGTGNDPQFNSINLGHASDTTIARDSAGVVSIEGAVVRTGTVAVANGGTGQTTYTNGQLLIGNTTGNTLAKATLTAGDGISITNGSGSITIANNTIIKSTVTYSSGSDIRSGAMTVPAYSIITRLTCVVKTELVHNDTQATTVKVGTGADGNQIASAVDLQASGTANTAAGIGSSTDSVITSGLTGAASIALTGSPYIVSETDFHFTVDGGAGISGGAMIFIVEYI